MKSQLKSGITRKPSASTLRIADLPLTATVGIRTGGHVEGRVVSKERNDRVRVSTIKRFVYLVKQVHRHSGAAVHLIVAHHGPSSLVGTSMSFTLGRARTMSSGSPSTGGDVAL